MENVQAECARSHPKKSSGIIRKSCAFGVCRSRGNQKNSNESEPTFVPFPQPCINVKTFRTQPTTNHVKICEHCAKCTLWLEKCARTDGRFEKISHINKYTVVCGKHFVNKSLIDKYPYPLPEGIVRLMNRSDKDLVLGNANNDLPLYKLLTTLRNVSKGTPSVQRGLIGKNQKLLIEEHNYAKITAATLDSRGTQTLLSWSDVECAQEENIRLKNEYKRLEAELVRYEKDEDIYIAGNGYN